MATILGGSVVLIAVLMSIRNDERTVDELMINPHFSPGSQPAGAPEPQRPTAARLVAVAAAGHLPTATSGSLNSYTTPGDTTGRRRSPGRARRNRVVPPVHSVVS